MYDVLNLNLNMLLPQVGISSSQPIFDSVELEFLKGRLNFEFNLMTSK